MTDDRYPAWPEMFRWLTVLKDRVETLPVIGPEQIAGGGALTGVSDTNVTVTLGGEPETALLKPVSLTIGWTGTLKVPRGGTGLSAVATGDILYGSASNVLSRLAATSNGFVLKLAAGLPAWTSGAALTRVDDTNVTLTLGGSPTVALLAATSLTLGWTGQLAVTRGGTGLAAVATGDLLYGSAANTLSRRAIGSAGDVLTVSGGLPVWAASSGLGTGDLTKVDDTNVTLTLGGAPTDALFKDVSLTLGWTGTLAVTRGGTGTGTAFTAGSVVFAGASGVYSQDNANFFYDDGNNRLGVRTTAPGQALQVGATGDTTSNAIRIAIAGGTAAASPVLSLFRGGIADSTIAFTSLSGNNAIIFSDDPSDYTSATLLSKRRISFDMTRSLILVGTATRSTTGTDALIFTEGTALATMASNTAGLYADDVGGTVKLFAIDEAGNGGEIVTVTGSRITLAAGTATAGTAPLKFTSGTNLTTAEAGAVEYNGTNLFFTRAGTVRENVLVAIDNVAAPATNAGTPTTRYGGDTNYLGDPNRWLSVNVLGATYKIPLYN